MSCGEASLFIQQEKIINGERVVFGRGRVRARLGIGHGLIVAYPAEGPPLVIPNTTRVRELRNCSTARPKHASECGA